VTRSATASAACPPSVWVRTSSIAGDGTPTARLPSPTAAVGDMAELIDICPIDDLPPGAMRLVEWEDLEIGVFNCAGELLAIEDRCSHDDGNLVEGELDEETCTIECPRHGSVFDLHTGKPLNLPAYVPVDTFPVSVEDGLNKIEVD
jgi:3-phenylpropionate/trans-cinnamate dioxygenase ferredoxin subunit